jgi:cellulose synthase/poly-beta-1,6-N-acetylglucosamine synthase-like glycosyltransferase
MGETLKILGFILFGIYVLTSVWLLLNAFVQLHLLWHYKRSKKTASLTRQLPTSLPFISIQLPVYNEKYVIERLLEAVSLLDYPKHLYEVQVLDDSTDETQTIIDRKVASLQAQGISATTLRRPDRSGFKAGALQYGLPYCKGELIAIFDADFVPHPGFLKNLVPHFTDPGVGLVQARWSHLNREENNLTRIQTFLLDTHFSIEQTGRSNAGYFINFCGTAGIWRKRCIEDAGGWDGNVLSEDLDISYRAQLKGWKLVYDEETEVPAELPSVIEAFKIQQFRWTKGMAQITRKNLGALLHSNLPWIKKLHGVFHLLGSFVFVCLFINALLTLPLLVFRHLYPEFITLTQYTLFTSLNLIALTLIYYNGTRSIRTAQRVKFFRHYPLFLVIYMGLSVQNALAVLQGLLGSRSAFIRTPKFNTNTATHTSYLNRKINWITLLELVTFCYFLYGIGLSVYLGDYFMMLFFVMISSGLGYLVYQSLALVVLKPYAKPSGWQV